MGEGMKELSRHEKKRRAEQLRAFVLRPMGEVDVGTTDDESERGISVNAEQARAQSSDMRSHRPSFSLALPPTIGLLAEGAAEGAVDLPELRTPTRVK